MISNVCREQGRGRRAAPREGAIWQSVCSTRRGVSRPSAIVSPTVFTSHRGKGPKEAGVGGARKIPPLHNWDSFILPVDRPHTTEPTADF